MSLQLRAGSFSTWAFSGFLDFPSNSRAYSLDQRDKAFLLSLLHIPVKTAMRMELWSSWNLKPDVQKSVAGLAGEEVSVLAPWTLDQKIEIYRY